MGDSRRQSDGSSPAKGLTELPPQATCSGGQGGGRPDNAKALPACPYRVNEASRIVSREDEGTKDSIIKLKVLG